MTRPGRYPPELRERAVRLVFEHQDEHPSQWAAITSIAHKFGVSAETLRKWVRRAETDDDRAPGGGRCGSVASAACVEGNSWPSGAGCRSWLMGLLLPDATTL
jgi:transposase-like protein